MVRQVAAGLAPETVGRIIARGDGVPLFVEELARGVAESGGETAVPASLNDTLMARLDRTAAMKEVAQTASVLGRDFSRALLAEVSPLAAGALDGALDTLLASGLLFRRAGPPHAAFAFKHALVRDAAYESLLVSSRRQLHARTAAALERAFPEVVAAQPELVAHHHEAAGEPGHAIDAWRRAGAKAAAASNYAEAERQLGHALGLLPQLPDGQRRLAELDLQMALGAVWRARRGTGSSGTRACFDRARVLCEEAGAEERLLEVVYGQFICAFNRPRPADAARHAGEFTDIARRLNDTAALKAGHYLAGITAFLLGDLTLARRELERCLAPGDADQARMAFYSQGQLPGAAMIYLAWTLLALGEVRAALTLAEGSIEVCRGGPAFQLAMALANASCLWHMSGDAGAVEARLPELFDLTAERGIVVFHEMARLFRGWALARRGLHEEGIALMRDALGWLAATEQKVELPHSLAILAERCIAAGHIAEARALLDEALGRVEETGERWYEAELHRLCGDLALAERDEAGAEAAFRRALAVAEGQSARLWSLRAATRLAGLLVAGGRRAEARSALAPVLAALPEGAGGEDVAEARRVAAAG
jgi:predicted ATPase